jgi:hypothetical protein
LNGAGAVTYTWSSPVTNNVPFAPSASSVYTVTGTNSNSCQNSTTIAIVVNSLPTITANASNSAICTGNSVTINALGANTYTISSNSGGSFTTSIAFSPTATSNYSVIGTSTDGCVSSNTSTLSITVNSLPTLSISATKSVLCLGDSTSFTASGALTYTWSGLITNGINFKPVTTGIYTVNATDINGCNNTAVRGLTVNSLPTLTVVSELPESCSGQTTTLTVSGASTYSWSNAINSLSVAVAPTVTSTYSVLGIDLNGCKSNINYTQLVAPCLASLNAITTSSNISCFGRSDGMITIKPIISYSLNTVQYLWSPSNLCPDNNCNTLTNLSAGNYTVKVVYTYTVENNFVKRDTISVKPITIEQGEACDVIVYNSFTPNNDGVNDIWEISNIDLYPKNKVTIFNRWGIELASISGYDNETKYWPDKNS